jgi:hypothetical protein
MPKRRSGAKKADSKGKPKVKRLPPTDAAARDEGPRLLPLSESKEPSRLEHYLELADSALGTNLDRTAPPGTHED